MKIKGRTVIREHPRFCCITQKQRENLPDKQIAQNIINKKMVTIFCMFQELCTNRKMRCGIRARTIKEVYQKFLMNYIDFRTSFRWEYPYFV